MTRRLLGGQFQLPQRLALFQSLLHRQQRLQFGLLFFPIGTRLLDGVLDAFDAAGHDVQVRDQQVLFEALQIRGRIVPVEGSDHDHQAARLANHRQPRGTAFVRAAEPRRVHHFERGQRDFLRMVDLAQIAARAVREPVAIADWVLWTRTGSGDSPVSQWNSVLLPEP